MTSPSSSVQEARRALGKRLSEIRLEAGLTKRALANSLGWHELWESTQRFRIYSPWLIPGPVQTASYITALLTSIRDRRGLIDDVPAAVKVRVEKQQIVYGNHTFAILLEEGALRKRIGGTDVMAGQLGYLLSVMALPSVSIGIIPEDADRSSLWPVEGFFLYDDQTVHIELVSAHLAVTKKHELAMYAQTFTDLAELSVYGPAAREIITAAIESLG
ncbi:hypothetical protein HRW14_05450 [Streptomyces lunaelactis]|uniref:DUF5753 domain-containing protein n=1 Tax=Streptomyces lunaelactis TaxID=1535768 RepID=UPI001585D20A|nr:DUF5753 domain-containing protein [Streptomyces lunaelactis]NUK49745.1 hypothetical protein [Streptomyces lunaelactis]NUK63199.1 hypothetical protein [Streptomyces lunaelactis]